MALCDKCKHKDSCSIVISPYSIVDQCPKFEKLDKKHDRFDYITDLV
jgi:hypothetical protein